MTSIKLGWSVQVSEEVRLEQKPEQKGGSHGKIWGEEHCSRGRAHLSVSVSMVGGQSVRLSPAQPPQSVGPAPPHLPFFCLCSFFHLGSCPQLCLLKSFPPLNFPSFSNHK